MPHKQSAEGPDLRPGASGGLGGTPASLLNPADNIRMKGMCFYIMCGGPKGELLMPGAGHCHK